MTTEAEAIARLYDLDLSVDPGDVELYEALAKRTGGPILELAIGSCRIAAPLAEAGYRPGAGLASQRSEGHRQPASN